MSTESQYSICLFFKRNPSFSPAEFRAYYENKHVPLVGEIVKGLKPTISNTRHYLDHEASDAALNNPFIGAFGDHELTVAYDVVTRVTFETKADALEYERVMYGIEENRVKIRADEDKLFLRDCSKVVVEMASS